MSNVVHIYDIKYDHMKHNFKDMYVSNAVYKELIDVYLSSSIYSKPPIVLLLGSPPGTSRDNTLGNVECIDYFINVGINSKLMEI